MVKAMTVGTKEDTLRERCREMLGVLQRDAMLRQGNPVESLLAFVLAEKGRAADASLESTKPLVLYFADDTQREEFLDIWKGLHIGSITKELP